MIVTLSGSMRAVPLAEAEQRARAAGRDAGVTRLTDVTALDRLGVPVAVAIRPTAHPGSSCVAAGKGLTLAEARVGALMEAVEQAWIEPGRSSVPLVRVRVKDILDGHTRHDAILDLCPRWGVLIDREAPTLAVEAHDVRTGEAALVPAELVFHPAPPHLGLGYFGSGTNGVAAGSTVAEATLHALVEVIERDALSFHNIRDTSERVADGDLPATVAELLPRIEAAHLRLVLRSLPNAFDLPCFTAVLVDRDQPQLSIRGDGLHPLREVALHRAVTEAAQCRLTIIHGGRDDLDHFVVRFAELDAEGRAAQGEALLARLEHGTRRRYADISGWAAFAGIDEALAAVCDRLDERGFRRILRVVYTPSDHPAQVVRAIVPGLECCLPETKRVGRRLRPYLRRSAR